MTLQVDDDLVKLASQLSAANKVRLLELLTDKSDVVHLDDVPVSSLPSPEGALPLSGFVEVVMHAVSTHRQTGVGPRHRGKFRYTKTSI
jgi:hypothetical protein